MRTIALALLSCLLSINAAAQRDGVTVIAHRGYWDCEEAGYAHNSIASLVQAQKHDMPGCEFDVYVCADSSIVLYHDKTVGDRKIEDMTLSELRAISLANGEPIPTLEDYLHQAARSEHTDLVLEIKPHSSPEVETLAVNKVLETLQRQGFHDAGRVMFISFSRHICEELLRLAPEFSVSFLCYSADPEEMAEAGIGGISINHISLSNKLVRKARELGLRLSCWTVNNPKAIRRAIRMGVDDITSDNPELVREILAEMGIKERKLIIR